MCTECTLVDPAISTTFLSFDYKDQMAQQDNQLKAYEVNLTVIK